MREWVSAILLPMGATAALLALSGGAGATHGDDFYADCWFSRPHGKLTVKSKNSEDVTLRRERRRITVVGERRVACKGGQATVRNTDRIKFVLRSDGIEWGVIALAGGHFAPGRSAENGAREIEINVLVRNPSATVNVNGTSRSDYLRGGELARAHGINLNPRREPDSPDADLRMKGRHAKFLQVALARGNDRLELGGGAEFRAPLRMWTLAFLGGGDDRYIGSARVDFVLAGRGRDEISTGAGKDLVRSRDGVAEPIDCGPGQDRIDPDDADAHVNCETVGFVGLVD
jgi:hypothetical protein